MTRLIVFGVSGIGKTTVCREYALSHPEFRHLTASELIRKASGTTIERLRTASSDQILRNQPVLAAALNEEVKASPDKKVILDGQCIIDNGREIIVIPDEMVASLRPTGFLLLEATPYKILERRAKSARLWPNRSAEQILSQLEMNRVAVKRYSANLRVPFVVVDANDDHFNLQNSVSALLSL